MCGLGGHTVVLLVEKSVKMAKSTQKMSAKRSPNNKNGQKLAPKIPKNRPFKIKFWAYAAYGRLHIDEIHKNVDKI